jgi:RNase P subunit RPR2
MEKSFCDKCDKLLLSKNEMTYWVVENNSNIIRFCEKCADDFNKFIGREIFSLVSNK